MVVVLNTFFLTTENKNVCSSLFAHSTVSKAFKFSILVNVIIYTQGIKKLGLGCREGLAFIFRQNSYPISALLCTFVTVMVSAQPTCKPIEAEVKMVTVGAMLAIVETPTNRAQARWAEACLGKHARSANVYPIKKDCKQQHTDLKNAQSAELPQQQLDSSFKDDSQLSTCLWKHDSVIGFSGNWHLLIQTSEDNLQYLPQPPGRKWSWRVLTRSRLHSNNIHCVQPAGLWWWNSVLMLMVSLHCTCTSCS